METKRRQENRAVRIKRLRLARELTLEQLGKMVGAQKAAVSKWEKDPNINIELNTFFKLAEVLEIDPRELLTGEPPKHKQHLPPRRQSLIDAYGRLPQELRTPLRMLIETIDVAATVDYAEWSDERRKEAEIRDQRRKNTEST